MNDDDRTKAVVSLLLFSESLDMVLGRLRQFPWDSEAELAVLQRCHVQAVLQRYIQSELTAMDVENWADAVEVRDDIGMESEKLKQIVVELANPVLFGDISPAVARKILSELAPPHAN